MIVKLASALNMSRQELERELRNSALGIYKWYKFVTMLYYCLIIGDKSGSGPGGSLLTKSILDSYWKKL